MHVAYSSDDLKNLARILSDILAQARKLDPDISTDDIVQRVCALADRGERNAKRLKNAALGCTRS